MSEKTEVRVWVVLGASVVLLLDAIVFYFIEGELFGPLFTGNVLVNALVARFVLVFPQSFTEAGCGSVISNGRGVERDG